MTAPTRPAPREAWVVWVVGLLVYVLAVFHRSSLGVAGLVATERFDISATQLATFTMLQLLVYAGMQVPVGLLVDRFGPRSVLLGGLVLMTLAQAAFAFADSYAVALARPGLRRHRRRDDLHLRAPAGQQLVPGAPDPAGHPADRHPRPARRRGRRDPDDLGAGPPRLDAGLPRRRRVRRGPDRWRCWSSSATPRARRTCAARSSRCRTVRQNLGASWAQPGTRLGFWMHFTTQFSATTMSLLWGYPFFVRGEGRSPATAGLLLTLIVVAIMAAGPVLGWLVGAHPWHRSTMVLTIVGALVAVWTAVLVWPGDAPLGAAGAAGRRRRARRAGLDDRLRRRPDLQPRPPARQRHRDHQPGRLLRQPVPRRGDRAGARLAYAGRRHRLPGRRRSAGR